MTKAEKYISELNKMKTPENAPIVEGIINGFNAIQNSEEYKQKTINEAIVKLEAARGTQNPVTFLKNITENILKVEDKKAKQEALDGLEQYKNYLVEAFDGTGIHKAVLANSLTHFMNMTRAAQSSIQLKSVIDTVIKSLSQLREQI